MKFTAVWDVMPWHLMEISNLLEEESSKMLVNFYQALWCHALSCSPMSVLSLTNISLVWLLAISWEWFMFTNIIIIFTCLFLVHTDCFPVLLFLNISLRSSKLMW